MSSMQYYPEDITAYARKSAGRFAYMQSCPSARCCIMQLCPPGYIYIYSCFRPVQNRPCSKLNTLGRRNTFAISLQAKCMSWMTWEIIGRWAFAAIIKYVNIHAALYVGSVHARSLTRAHQWTVICIAPDTIAHAKVSGEDSIAWRTQLHLTPANKVLAGIRLGPSLSVRINEPRRITSDVQASVAWDSMYPLPPD